MPDRTMNEFVVSTQPMVPGKRMTMADQRIQQKQKMRDRASRQTYARPWTEQGKDDNKMPKRLLGYRNSYPFVSHRKQGESMSRASHIITRLNAIMEHDGAAPGQFTPEDTILHNVTRPELQCPTCGHALKTGVLTPSQIQCPMCMHDVDVATGDVIYRTKSPNMSRGQYDRI